MKHTTRAAILAAATAAWIACGASSAAAGARIVNGLPTEDFPTTGALLYGYPGLPITANNAITWCSGVLIGCHTFLTAAHCVAGDSVAGHYEVYLQNGGILAVASVTYDPQYTTDLWSHDVAVVKLASAVNGIEPSAINSTHNAASVAVGKTGVIAGFGRTGGGNDYGIKNYGDILTTNCDTVKTGGFGSDVLVCWNYDANVGAPGTDSNTCNGDSGGPLFMDFGGSTEVVGVTSAGVNAACGVGDHSWDASVYAHASWITSQLGADSTTTCGNVAPVGNGATTVQQHSGTLDFSNIDDSFTVNVSGTPPLLRFTLNGTDNGFNPNLFVKHGSAASAVSYDCKSDGTSVFGECSIANPAAGSWSVFVQRGSGSGDWQVTTTVFGSSTATCGDGGLNGNITASDALATLKAAVGSLSRPLCACDVNDSGTITSTDGLLVLKAAVGQPVTLHCPAC